MNNKTFAVDNQSELNAVVGSNWPGDNTYSYVLGFEQAVEVLLAAAVEGSYVDPMDQERKAIYIDALIYPICFCARHFIELFLKRQISLVSTLRGKSDNGAGTHDLASLWNRLQGHFSADRRLEPLAAPMGEFINDFASVDETGETFRYAFDLQNSMHLTGHSHINIPILAERLQKLRSYAEDFEHQIEALRDEYRQKTFTSKLSREDLRQVATKLPQCSDWGSDSFKVAKVNIQQEFGLSSNDFSKAISKIKGHREFSSIVGTEIPLEGLSVNIFDQVKKIKDGEAGYESISRDEWACLAAVCEIGRLGYYSDAYDFLFTLYLSEEYETRTLPSDLLREMLGRHNRFRIGLQKLGQPTLAKKFEAIFPKAPEEPRKSPDELRKMFKKQFEQMRSKGKENQA